MVFSLKRNIVRGTRRARGQILVQGNFIFVEYCSDYCRSVLLCNCESIICRLSMLVLLGLILLCYC